MNKFMVSAKGNEIVILKLQNKFTVEDAFNLSVWLFVMAEINSDGKLSIKDFLSEYDKAQE